MPPLDSNRTAQAVRAEQIRLLYHQATPMQLLGVVTALIPVSMYRDVVEQPLLLAWFGAMVVVTVLRLLLNLRFVRLPASRTDIDRWGELYIAGTFASGLVWASLALFYDPAWPVAHQLVLFVIFTGIIAGAFNTNSVVLWAFPAFYVPPAVMLMYVILTRVEQFEELLLLIVIYIGLMAISSRRYYRRLSISLRTQIENEALARALEKSNQSLMQLAEVDELTQLYNRRTMDRFLGEEWERHLRATKPLSLLYIDIDYFKQYNDTYGHLRGDEVLVRVARVFRDYTKRATDMAVRFGGEEFALILPETDYANAYQIAESLRESVEALQIEHTGSAIAARVTVSIGVATMIPAQPGSFDVLKTEADRALYQAKAQGRNCVV